jgi:hypothetical protein
MQSGSEFRSRFSFKSDLGFSVAAAVEAEATSAVRELAPALGQTAAPIPFLTIRNHPNENPLTRAASLPAKRLRAANPPAVREAA